MSKKGNPPESAAPAKQAEPVRPIIKLPGIKPREKRKLDELNSRDWIPLSEVRNEIEASAQKFTLRFSHSDTLGHPTELGWSKGDSAEVSFTLPVSHKGSYNDDFVRLSQWKKVKKEYGVDEKAALIANGVVSRGAGTPPCIIPIAPLAEDYVDVVVDANILDDLTTKRSGNRTWLDLLRIISTLPNIRVVFVTVVLDNEGMGNTAHFENDKIHLRQFDPLTSQHEDQRDYKTLVQESSRVIVDDRAKIIKTIEGANPKFVIWHSPRQEAYYNQIIGEKIRLLGVHKGNTKKTFEDLKTITSHAGDEAIMHYCTSRACTRPVIILTTDMDLKNRALASYIPNTGHAIGVVLMSGFLQAVEKTYNRELSGLLEKYCNAGEQNTTSHYIADKINSSQKSGSIDLEGYVHFNIFPGTDASNKPGEPFDKVLARGRKLQLEWERKQAQSGHEAGEAANGTGDSAWGSRIAQGRSEPKDPDSPPRA